MYPGLLGHRLPSVVTGNDRTVLLPGKDIYDLQLLIGSVGYFVPS